MCVKHFINFVLVFSCIISPIAEINNSTSFDELREEKGLSLLIRYLDLDINEGKMIIGISGNGYGLGKKSGNQSFTTNIRWIAGWGAGSKIANVSCYHLEDDLHNVNFHYENWFGTSSNMIFYPYDTHRAYFHLEISDIQFYNIEFIDVSFIPDFSVLNTNINLLNYSESLLFSNDSTYLEFDCFVERRLWGQIFLTLPVIVFYITLAVISTFSNKIKEKINISAIILSIIIFTALNIWGIYGTIKHSTSGPAILEMDLILLLIMCISILIYESIEELLSIKLYQRHNLLRLSSYLPFYIPGLYWLYYCYFNPGIFYINISSLGKLIQCIFIPFILSIIPIAYSRRHFQIVFKKDFNYVF